MSSTRHILVLVILPLAALAQVQTPNTIYVNGFADGQNGNGSLALVVGTNNCDTIATITYNLSAANCATSAWLTTTSCGTSPGASDTALTVTTSTTTPGFTASKKIRDFPAFQPSDGGSNTCPSAINVTYLVCGSYQGKDTFGNCASTNTTITAATIKYKGAPPPIPSFDGLTAQDSALTVSASTSDSDTSQINIFLRVSDAGTAFVQSKAFINPSNQTSTKVPNLVNNVTYDVAVQALDIANNTSDYSNVLQGTPIASDGFIDTYHNLGGREAGGCRATPAGLSLLVIPAALVAGLMRRKRSCRR